MRPAGVAARRYSERGAAVVGAARNAAGRGGVRRAPETVSGGEDLEIRAVREFLWEAGAVVQFLHREELVAEGRCVPEYGTRQLQFISAAARRMVAASAVQGWPSFMGLMLPAVLADGQSPQAAADAINALCPQGSVTLAAQAVDNVWVGLQLELVLVEWAEKNGVLLETPIVDTCEQASRSQCDHDTDCGASEPAEYFEEWCSKPAATSGKGEGYGAEPSVARPSWKGEESEVTKAKVHDDEREATQAERLHVVAHRQLQEVLGEVGDVAAVEEREGWVEGAGAAVCAALGALLLSYL